jgi:transposase
MATVCLASLIDGLPDGSRCPGCQRRDAIIAELRQANARLQATVDQQSACIQELETQTTGVQKRLDDLSKKQPPRPRSQEAKETPPPAKKRSGRKPGGQPGHPPHPKVLLPAERVVDTHAYVPDACAHCAAKLPVKAGASDPAPKRHQVIDIPASVAFAIEHQAHARTCPCCGKLTWAVIPADIRAHTVGPRLAGTLAYLVGAHKLSKRGAVEVADELFAAPLALGTVANLEREMSRALEPAYAEAKQAVQAADVKNVDETGWKKNGAKRWLWVAATQLLAVFLIHPLRNHVAMALLLGSPIRGIVCSDRWRTYERLGKRFWQICWAHLKRNFQKLVERGGKAKEIGQCCLAVLDQVFELWHQFRGGGCTRAQLRRRMQPLRQDLREFLEEGSRSRNRKLARFCQRLLKVFPALWTFVRVQGVEPTNNHGERVLRLAVLWRKNCFGCHSDNGCRFVERLITAVQSLRLQKRSVLEFLCATIEARRAGEKPPSLLPGG